MSVAPARPDPGTVARAYVELTKPRIVLLVLLTGVPALVLASRGLPTLRTIVASVLGTALAAASAAAFNHVFDRDIDAVMLRTKNRPLPLGTLTPTAGLVFAWGLAVLAAWVLWAWGNPLAAAVGLASIAYYAGVYTLWLKRTTPQNIVIGGAAGATAPLIAWAVVTGRIELPAVLLAAIVFFWTPPHFWALALYRREDYARAGIPMLPVTHGEAETRRQILLYTLGLVPITLAPFWIGAVGAIYAVPALALGLAFAWFAWRLFRTAETARAVRLFRFSILYLFVLFAALGVDASVTGLANQQRARVARQEAAAAVAAARAPLVVTVRARGGGEDSLVTLPERVVLETRRGVENEANLRVENPGRRAVRVSWTRLVSPPGIDSLVRETGRFPWGRASGGPSDLGPGAKLGGPLRFVIDPRLPAGVDSVTIDYSFVALPAGD